MSNTIQNETLKLKQFDNSNLFKRNVLLNKRIETINSSTSTKDIMKTIYPSKKLEIKILNLPKINSKSIETSPRYNHNRKIIKIKKRLFEKDFKNNSKDKFILTEINNNFKIKKKEHVLNKKNNILTQQISEKKFNQINNDIFKNQQFEVSDLLMNEIQDLEKETKSIFKRKIIHSPNLNDLFLKKGFEKKKTKKIKQLDKINYSMKNIRDKTNCYLDFQTKKNLTSIRLETNKLNKIEKKITNVFDLIRNDADYRFHELLTSDKIQFD